MTVRDIELINNGKYWDLFHDPKIYEKNRYNYHTDVSFI